MAEGTTGLVSLPSIADDGPLTMDGGRLTVGRDGAEVVIDGASSSGATGMGWKPERSVAAKEGRSAAGAGSRPNESGTAGAFAPFFGAPAFGAVAPTRALSAGSWARVRGPARKFIVQRV